ncbi:MAG: HAD-IIA family hydrolase [bacterium]|nr:HAD-IIA family hydrolase [bacterium]
MKSESSFEKIAPNYRAIFFDAYGVLRNSSGIIDGVPEVLARLQQTGIDCYVITNDASKSPEKMRGYYVHPQRGEIFAIEKIVSSGMLASEFLAGKVGSGKVAYLGKPASAYYIEEAGLEAVPVAEVKNPEEIRCMVFLDDEGFDWYRDLNRTLNLLRKVNIPVIVANTDTSYPVKSGEVAVAVGSLASMIESIVGKTFIRFGKPDTQIFSFTYERALHAIPDLNKRQILMVGDTLHTDILGANQFGVDTALVLSGNTQKEKARLQIRSRGIIPTYLFDSILT